MDYYLSEIRIFAGNYAPVDFKLCDGSLLPINSYQALFTLIGTKYGGDGVNTFGLPDLRGRLPVGQGTGTGLTPRLMGSTGGAETVAVDSTQIPAHSHNFVVSTVPANISQSTNAPTGSSYLGVAASNAGVGVAYISASATGVSTADLNSGAVIANPGGQAHSNLMPFGCITYIICVQGLFPMQN